MQRRNSSKKIIFVFFLWLISIIAIFFLHDLSVNQAKQSGSVVMTTDALTWMADELHMDLKGMPSSEYPLPKNYKDVERVGTPNAPSMEKIKKLNADSVYSVTTLKDMQGDSYKANDINVKYVNLQTVADLKKSMNMLAKKYHKETYAQAFIDKLDKRQTAIEQENKNRPRQRVLVLFGMPGGSYLQATSNSYIGSLVEITNNKVIEPKNSHGEYISVNMEEIQKSKPEIVICLAHAMPETVEKSFKQEFSNKMWQSLPAFQNKKVYYLREPTYSSTANMNVIKAMNGIDKIVNK